MCTGLLAASAATRPEQHTQLQPVVSRGEGQAAQMQSRGDAVPRPGEWSTAGACESRAQAQAAQSQLGATVGKSVCVSSCLIPGAHSKPRIAGNREVGGEAQGPGIWSVSEMC